MCTVDEERYRKQDTAQEYLRNLDTQTEVYQSTEMVLFG